LAGSNPICFWHVPSENSEISNSVVEVSRENFFFINFGKMPLLHLPPVTLGPHYLAAESRVHSQHGMNVSADLNVSATSVCLLFAQAKKNSAYGEIPQVLN
jgi:hypothetical protein